MPPTPGALPGDGDQGGELGREPERESGRGAVAHPVTTAAWHLLGADARPLSGGYSGETFLVGAPGEEAVLRLYLRDPGRAGIDAALFALVRDLVPVPRVLDLRTRATPEQPAYLLMERLPGEPLDRWLPDASPQLRKAAGAGVGRVLARLSGMPFPTAGEFADADLRVRPWAGAAGGLEEWVDAHRESGALAAWSFADVAGLREVARQGQDLLDGVRRSCLCHSDFNPKNLLVDPGTGEVTGLVDWEYAHAGNPYADLGNLLRFETDEVFATAVVDALRTYGPPLDPAFRQVARAVDLFALVDLAGRAEHHEITRAATDLLLRCARARDLSGGRPG
ncbi:Phosphotransferase enzyme family protein [Actinopolymorpha cephalotaxi]|uniref:Aminoglycoside phosphotransferase (APT) family kinase protein n=1 Tax=Actinopolymorpha cephalotaxi TaxID=504797 RepID=A0A1I2W2N5_9ACTN|nr:phosphotransferase [Actinopolymorpha cephalotaxi]NYH82781.1 aminoglycoside phosphotransferase (APT) family kinase protein [Actinopolymorpha cephalotaxi]SFG95718.1 Phosphotransferase enzyme family protein [Actinopolymorpha cephalotaxi]